MNKKIIWLCTTILLMLAKPALAGDLSSDVRKGANDSHANDGNYFEMEFGMVAYDVLIKGVPEDSDYNKVNNSLTLVFNMHFQYKNWFIENFSQSLESFTFGYHFTDGDGWSLDAVALGQHPEISQSMSHDLKGIKKREGDFMSGLRATGYYGNYIVQLHALTDISDTHYGQVYSAKVARHWQYKNWNFHAILGSSYRTEKVADYYFSVQPEDVTDKFPEFHAQAGFTKVLEVGATYPISQKWVFRSLVRHVELDHQWAGSPIIASDQGNMIAGSLSYVF